MECIPDMETRAIQEIAHTLKKRYRYTSNGGKSWFRRLDTKEKIRILEYLTKRFVTDHDD